MSILLVQMNINILIYLAADVLEGGRVDEGEADEEDVGVWVAQRTQAVIILLVRHISPHPIHSLALISD